ncbi:MAG: MarR family transcriptional regulator [Actinobacteria bacterium]|nr:MarR family transcriptional regulator [Actinomycetota bacterium]
MPERGHDPLADEELSWLLGIAFQVILAEFNRRLDDVGHGDLRPVHGMIFQIAQGEGVTSTELADRLGVTKQAAGQLVTDLEKRGYVSREEHPQGGRRRLIVLTDKAIDHLNTAGPILHQLEAELAAQAGDLNLTGLRTELARIIRAIAGTSLPPLRPVW